MSAADHRLMGLALALGRRNLGRTWPNPSVGAVLIDPADGRILAQGATQPGGRPHAEIVALRDAGEAAHGATLYVSLEPCSHQGRTPPCADAIVAARLGRVVTAIGDPNPLVAGRGHARLREAGIAVREAIREAEAGEAHRGHIARIITGRPYVTLKLARTADGFAGRLGRRVMITGEETNARTHMRRAHVDAVMVGVATVLADDPRLDVRLPGLADRSPVRVVLDGRLAISLDARIVRSAGERPTWIVVGEAALRAEPERAEALRAAGAELIGCPTGPDGRLDLSAAMAELGRRGLTTILSEGGPTLAEALARADLLDEVILATAPMRLDEPGIAAVGPTLERSLAQCFRLVHSEASGPDRLDIWRRSETCSPAS